ncbi:MAG: Hsp20/alpha crystallin family protein [Bifidobacteriaceae bacterium]|nr:Hsp20/alpha crystallin family protein [Bifidobacteriaceae bacterium]MCI1915391.1 Hsp20/alpha crystallin family protein [Bifidobacteriaceae bacterium]
MAMLPALFDDTVMSDVFSDPFFTQPVPSHFSAMMAPTTMTTDIKESDKGYDLTIDMPGFSKDDISVSVDGGYLTVSGEQSGKHDEKGEDGKFLRRERYAGSCSRSYYVGEAVTSKDVTAHYENGTLHLLVPKKVESSVEQGEKVQIEG